jgi:hypothetical protein
MIFFCKYRLSTWAGIKLVSFDGNDIVIIGAVMCYIKIFIKNISSTSICYNIDNKLTDRQ